MIRIQICLEMSGDFVWDMSGDSCKMLFKHFCSIFLEGHMFSYDFCAFVQNLVKIWAKAGGRGIQKRTILVRILGVISDPPGIDQASLKHRSSNTKFGQLLAFPCKFWYFLVFVLICFCVFL